MQRERHAFGENLKKEPKASSSKTKTKKKKQKDSFLEQLGLIVAGIATVAFMYLLIPFLLRLMYSGGEWAMEFGPLVGLIVLGLMFLSIGVLAWMLGK